MTFQAGRWVLHHGDEYITSWDQKPDLDPPLPDGYTLTDTWDDGRVECGCLLVVAEDCLDLPAHMRCRARVVP